jgi:hypothetical protein
MSRVVERTMEDDRAASNPSSAAGVAPLLKQVLWSLILSLDGVTGIDDQLDVVSSTGLSRIRPR